MISRNRRNSTRIIFGLNVLVEYEGNLILTGGFIVWSFNAMYMSGDYWYELGDVLSTIATVYLYIEMKREGEKI